MFLSISIQNKWYIEFRKFCKFDPNSTTYMLYVFRTLLSRSIDSLMDFHETIFKTEWRYFKGEGGNSILVIGWKCKLACNVTICNTKLTLDLTKSAKIWRIVYHLLKYSFRKELIILDFGINKNSISTLN